MIDNRLYHETLAKLSRVLRTVENRVGLRIDGSHINETFIGESTDKSCFQM